MGKSKAKPGKLAKLAARKSAPPKPAPKPAAKRKGK